MAVLQDSKVHSGQELEGPLHVGRPCARIQRYNSCTYGHRPSDKNYHCLRCQCHPFNFLFAFRMSNTVVAVLADGEHRGTGPMQMRHVGKWLIGIDRGIG